MSVTLGARSPSNYWSVALIGTGVVAFYVLGAGGLQIRSVEAAVMMVIVQTIEVMTSRISDGYFTVETTLILIALLIVLRGIYLAAQWERAHEPSEPLSYNVWFRPPKEGRWAGAVWPRLHIVFFVLGALILGQNRLYDFVLIQD